MKKSNFTSDLIFKTLAELVTALLGIITFGVISRSLSKGDYAALNQMTSIGTLIAPILLIKMNNAFCVFLSSEKDKIVLKSRFFTVTILTFPICLIMIFTFMLFQNQLALLIFDDVSYSTVIVYMSVYFMFLAFSTLSQDYFRALRKMKLTSIIIIVRSILLSLLIIILFMCKSLEILNLILLVYCLIEFCIAIVGYVILSYVFKKIPFIFQIEPLKEYYRYALPLMPYLIMSWLNTFVGKFILTHLIDLESTGIYSFNYSVVSRLFFLNVVIGYTVFPYISKFWNEGKLNLVSEYLEKGFNIGILFSLPIMTGLFITAPTIINLLSGDNYPVDKMLLVLICIAMIFQLLYNIYAYLIDLSRKTVWYNFIFLVTSVINILLNIVLVKAVGLNGVAISLIITYFIQFILTCIIGVKSTGIKLHFNFKFIALVIFSSFCMYIVVNLVYSNSGIPNFILSACIGIVIYFAIIYFGIRINKILVTKIEKT